MASLTPSIRGEVAGHGLAVAAEASEVLAVDLHLDGTGVRGRDRDHPLPLERLGEAGLGEPVIRDRPIDAYGQPRGGVGHPHRRLYRFGDGYVRRLVPRFFFRTDVSFGLTGGLFFRRLLLGGGLFFRRLLLGGGLFFDRALCL